LEAGNVWSAFLCARNERIKMMLEVHRLMLEVHRLRSSRQEHVQDTVTVLSSMLRNFSEDVLWSQYMRSAAAAAVASSESTRLTQSTEDTQTREMHVNLKPDYSTSVEGRNRSRMSILHACGIMHAAERISDVCGCNIYATTFTEGGITETCPHLPDVEAGEAGRGTSSQLKAESGCAVKGTYHGIRDPPAATLPETLPPTVVQHGPTWHEVCIKSSRSVPLSC
jgi:hypothetical protein